MARDKSVEENPPGTGDIPTANPATNTEPAEPPKKVRRRETILDPDARIAKRRGSQEQQEDELIALVDSLIDQQWNGTDDTNIMVNVENHDWDANEAAIIDAFGAKGYKIRTMGKGNSPRLGKYAEIQVGRKK